jgi:exopolyphosphatase/pppGpp-phosphohydrolase
LKKVDNDDEVISRTEKTTEIIVEAISGGKEAEVLQKFVNQAMPI